MRMITHILTCHTSVPSRLLTCCEYVPIGPCCRLVSPPQIFKEGHTSIKMIAISQAQSSEDTEKFSHFLDRSFTMLVTSGLFWFFIAISLVALICGLYVVVEKVWGSRDRLTVERLWNMWHKKDTHMQHVNTGEGTSAVR